MNFARRIRLTALLGTLLIAGPAGSTAVAVASIRPAYFPSCTSSRVAGQAHGRLERPAAVHALAACGSKPTPRSLRLTRLTGIDHRAIP